MLKQNETFLLCNCTMAKCIENNTIEIVPYECPHLEMITCANGKKPVLVDDEYKCCKLYVSDCLCEGWGDPHYITFDGLFYSYQGNCTYVLMEEISPKHKLNIYIDNVYCDPTEDVSCPRSIIISFQSEVFTLINHNLLGAVEAHKNGIRLKLPYAQQGVKILDTGINLVLEIPRLKVVITFGITGFSVTLPYSDFGSNTQGHCGTCNNNQADDCKLPGGQLVEDCAVMADFWPAKHIEQPDCQIPSVPPTNKPGPPPIVTPCKPDSICHLLKSRLFEACHPVVSPDNFYQGCVFDSCHVSNPAVECTSLQTYAAACAQAGKVTALQTKFTSHVVLQNSQLVKTRCLDPEGNPREFNERFEYKCQSCICGESTKTVSCKPKECPTAPVTSCMGPGFVLINTTNPSDPCCSAFVCGLEREKGCKTVSTKTFVMHKGCQSYNEVAIPYCEGTCNTFTKYSKAAAAMQHSCSCCR
ncbi:hypothetical protein KUCAC02_020976 [Chaenocephalus aceratus]|uniref:Uncharacterized protein n=1 Tax=Chaenocephalus aceratus TaxID=36190 RepID=A0ACB9XFV5_CHAAC|nr:hypothetical protein KUCAC02_020976 [Chaenocephalus aceratus]